MLTKQDMAHVPGIALQSGNSDEPKLVRKQWEVAEGTKTLGVMISPSGNPNRQP